MATNHNLFVRKTADSNSVFIQFNVPEKSLVLLKVMNENDEQIRLLLNEILVAGQHETNFNYTNLNKGKYIVRLMVDNNTSIEIENIVIHI